MKIGLLHLTDIHFTAKTDVTSKTHSLANVMINDFADVKRIYIVVSGDIAYSGKKEEYDKAWSFFSVLKQLIAMSIKNVELRFVMVPGNHDCDFSEDSQLRKTVIQNMSYNTIGDDESVIQQCLTVQHNFWAFYSRYNATPANRIFYSIKDAVDGKTIAFHCLNTAVTSQLHESPGGLFFPSKKIDATRIEKGDLNFGVWHHPTNWFNPNTQENNKLEVDRFVENLASTHFLGHEHHQSAHAIENSNTNRKINLLSGEVFNEDKKSNKSGFQTILFDTDNEKGNRKVYSWDKSIYKTNLERSIVLYKEDSGMFSLNDVFIKSLMEVKIPLVIETKKDLKLSDIFVFQDLDPSFKDTNYLEGYFNARRLLDQEEGVSILDGESQVGKSSLLSMLYINLFDHGIYPILLKGRDISELNIEKYIRRAFKAQYKADCSLDQYLQLPKEKKAILIDDFHESGFNSATVDEMFQSLLQRFGHSFIVYDSANSLLSSMKTDNNKIKSYTIRPFGYKKRNELIERYLFLKNNPLTYNENSLFNDAKDLFNKVQSVLGDKLLPSYPIYILSIIQALQYKPLKNETSFGYCYQTLIHYSLHSAGVENEELDTYFNFLTELAYHFLINDLEVKPHHTMPAFFNEYAGKYISPQYESLLQTLKKSKLLKSDSDGIAFGYQYILYYLSAKKISDIMHTDEGKAVLKKLFDKLEDEKNANVLVFITHHTKDVSFIESSLINLMSVLENVKPISLKKDDPYYAEISSFVQKIKNDIIDLNRNHKEERERMLSDGDRRLATERPKIDESDQEEMSRQIQPFLQSYRAVEIVGQIIKNRHGSIEIPQLRSLIEELYTTGFRTVTFYNEVLNSAKADIITAINEKVDEGDTKREIEERVSEMLQALNYRMCLGIFNRLTQAAGNKELKRLYDEVAKQMGTPAAKILSFGINLRYSTLNIKQLSDLTEELKDNVVALKLLKARVKGYVYNHDVNFSLKQQIASVLKMELTARPSANKSISEKANF